MASKLTRMSHSICSNPLPRGTRLGNYNHDITEPFMCFFLHILQCFSNTETLLESRTATIWSLSEDASRLK